MARDESRAKILSVATRLVAQHGMAGVKVDQVSRGAELNKRMIYHYFTDKAGLLGAVLGRQCAVLAAALGPAVDAGSLMRLVAPDAGGAAIERVSESASNISDREIEQAAGIVLCALLQARAAESVMELQDAATAELAREMLRLVLDGRAAPKPRYKMRSASRPAPARS